MKIPISFKKTEQDLYDFLNSKRSPSCYIKDLLEKEMQQNNNSNMNTEVVNNNNSDEFIGFDI
ncbi:hypothetical protein AB2T85_06820 [Clostridium butyricum]|uniref:hypothetical protein n=1 Tax=Clostridium butyricum TaxID=1492 RepID=UPI00346711F5